MKIKNLKKQTVNLTLAAKSPAAGSLKIFRPIWIRGRLRLNIRRAVRLLD